MKTSSIVATLILVLMNGLVVAQTDALTILPNGNVGVGTTTPTQKLEVQGNGIINRVFLGDVGLGENWAGFSHKNALGAKSYGFLHHVYGIQSLINIKSDPNGFIGFRVENQDKMVIRSNGNVGIGITIPKIIVDVKENSIIGSSVQPQDQHDIKNRGIKVSFGHQGTNFIGMRTLVASGTNGGGNSGDISFDTWEYNTSTSREVMRINGTGNVGIGSKTPTQAKLVVSGNTLSNVAYQGYYSYFILHGRQQTGFRIDNTRKVTEKYSIYASNRIAAEEFNAFSDARIKNIFGVSNASKDLETLSKIEVTDYTMIDTISKGNQSHKKVIAQQVKEVYPQAVSSNLTDVIPNIYALSTIKDGWINTNTKDLVVGDKVKLIFTEEEALVDVLEIQRNAIKVASNQEGQVFVYGKQVSNFHTVDYEAISMLNVSATQALLKRIELLEAEKKKLTGDFENYKTSVNDRLLKIERILQTETVMN